MALAEMEKKMKDMPKMAMMEEKEMMHEKPKKVHHKPSGIKTSAMLRRREM